MNYAGIDISKDTFDVCFYLDDNQHYNVFDQTEKGFYSFLSVFNMFKIDIVGFESTGVYHKAFEKYLRDNGVNPIILSPRKVSLFVKSSPIVGKTDKSDAFGIALYLSKHHGLSSLVHPIREEFRPILSSIQSLEKQSRQLKNLLHAYETEGFNDKYIIKHIKKSAAVLDDAHINVKNHALKHLHKRIPEAQTIKNEIKGVGDGILLYVLPFLYDHFDKYTVKQWSSMFGIAPVPHRSGTTVYKRSHISKRGNLFPRKMLYMSAIASVRSNHILKEKYLRLREAGKPPKVALVAIMNHLLRTLIYKLSEHTGRPIKK